jgi:Putative zinc-finger
MNQMTTPTPTPTLQHREMWDLIPWVVAGSASAEDCQRLQRHAATCEDCRDELAFHHQVQRGMQASVASTPSPEPALQRLWARIDQDAVPPSLAPPRPAGHKPAATWHRWLSAAVVVQAVGLATLAGLLMARKNEGQYQTLSTTPPTLTPTSSAATLRLVPAATLPAGQLAALLSQHGLHIVESSQDGTVLGLALLPQAQATPHDVALRLRLAPGVLLAEPIAQATGP